MNAYLYRNDSDERYVDKNITPLYGSPITCIFKDDTNMINPTLIFTSNIVANVNYIWLEDTQRYYFVRNRTYSQQRVYVECEVDVLMTYRNEIRQQNVIVSRNEFNYNLYQNDDEWKVYGYTAIRTIPFPSGFDMSKQEFVLAIAGGEGSDG